MKNKALMFSISVAAILLLFLVISIFAIVYYSWGDASAVQSSISTLSGLFGGLATLGTAVVAGYLFNDWRAIQKYTNEVKVSESLNAAIDCYIQSFNSYVEVMWRARFDPDQFLMDQIFHNERLKNEKKKLNEALYKCRICFKPIDFDLLDNHVAHIEKALKNIHPFSLNENDSGLVDSKYIRENENLCLLSQDLYSLYINEIRNPIFDYLLKNALN